MKSFKFCLLFMVLLTSTTTFAQSKLTGSWELKQKTSLTGVDYVNTIDDSLKIVQMGKEWAIVRSNNGQTITEPLPSGDENKEVATSDNRTKRLTAKWKASNVLAIDKFISQPGTPEKIAITVHDEYVWSADGQTLTVTRVFKNTTESNDQWSASGVYNKK